MSLKLRNCLAWLIALAVPSSFIILNAVDDQDLYSGFLGPPLRWAQRTAAVVSQPSSFESEPPQSTNFEPPPSISVSVDPVSNVEESEGEVPGEPLPQSSLAPSSGPCPEVLPWDSWNRSTSKVVKFDFRNQPHRQDGMGNKMFAFAARAIYAVDHGLPLQVQNHENIVGHSGSGEVSFPCARSSKGLEDISQALNPVQLPGCAEHAFCQELPTLWGLNITGRKTLLKAAFQIARPAPDADDEFQSPGPDDLVIHFRSYDYGRRRLLAGRIKFTGFRMDSFQAAPFRFYKKVIDDHRASHPRGVVWLVAERKTRSHTIAERLVSEAGVRIFDGCDESELSAMCDFNFMMEASTLALSPSTFSWWAAYLGNGEVHYPILPGKIGPGIPWCLLVNNDPQWIYHFVFHSNSTSWKQLRGVKTAAHVAGVRDQCESELQGWDKREDVSDVHSMFDMPPPTAKRKVIDRSREKHRNRGDSNTPRGAEAQDSKQQGPPPDSHEFPRYVATANDTVHTSLAYIDRLKPALKEGVFDRLVEFMQGNFNIAVDRTCSGEKNVCVGHSADYHMKFSAEEIIPNSIMDSPWLRPGATNLPSSRALEDMGPRLMLQLTTCRRQALPAIDCMAAVHSELRSAGFKTPAQLAEQLRKVFFIFTFDYGPCGPRLPNNRKGYKDVAFQASPLLTQNGHKDTPCYDPAKDIIIPTGNAHRPYAESLRHGPMFERFGDSKQLLEAGVEASTRQRPQLAYFVTGAKTLEHKKRIEILDAHVDSENMRIIALEPHKVAIEQMLTSKFCIEADGNQPWSPRLVEYLVLGCVPVIVSNLMVPPFQRTFDWERMAVLLPHTEDAIDDLEVTLEDLVDSGKYAELRKNALAAREAFIYELNPRLGALPIILYEMDQVLKTWKGNATAAAIKLEAPKAAAKPTAKKEKKSRSPLDAEDPAMKRWREKYSKSDRGNVPESRGAEKSTSVHSGTAAVPKKSVLDAAPVETDDVGYNGTAPTIEGELGHVLGADGTMVSFTDLRSTVQAAIDSDKEASVQPPAGQLSKMIILSTADIGYRKLAWNWACKLRELGVQNFVLFAIDHKIAESLRQHKVNSFYAPALAKSSDDAIGLWGSTSYNSVVHLKTKQQLAVLKLGFDAFYLDVDISVRVDVRNDLVRMCPDCDILVQQNWPMLEMNPGCTLFRSRPATQTLLSRMLLLEEKWEDEDSRPGAKRVSADHSHGDQVK